MDYEKFFAKQIEFLNSLSKEKILPLVWYTGSGSHKLLSQFRKDKELSKEMKIKFENMQYVFDNIPPLEEPIQVYRGQKTENINELVGVLSTSVNKKIAERFTAVYKKCCLYSITIPSGVRVIPLKTISQHPREEEVLINGYGRIDIIDEKNGIFECVYTPEVSYELKIENIDRLDIKEMRKELTQEKINSFINLVDPEEKEYIYSIDDAKKALEGFIYDKETLEIVAKALLDEVLL